MMSPLVASTENLLLAASPGLASWNTPSSDRRLYTSAELRLLSRSSATAVSVVMVNNTDMQWRYCLVGKFDICAQQSSPACEVFGIGESSQTKK